MRTHHLTAIACTLLAGHALAAEPAITIRPVQIISQAEVPEGAPDDAKSVMFTKGFSIGYLVEGQDLIGFDDESLVLDTLATPDGKNLAKKRNGEKNYKLGSFPKASDDGKYAFFQIESDERPFGHVESLTISGTITVRTGSDLTTVATKAHVVSSKETEKIGEYEVAFGDSAGAGILRFGGADAKPSVAITITGPIAKLTKMRLLIDGKEVDDQGYMSEKGSPKRTYQFGVDAKASGTVELTYWKNFAEQPVKIGK